MDTKRIKIVIGDNTADYGESYAVQLRQEGFSVITQPRNSRSILDTIIQEQPDIVVTDALLPQLDALAIMEWCQYHEKVLETKPLFLITARYENDYLKEQLLHNGASCFLCRPFPVSYLSYQIYRLMETKVREKPTPPKKETMQIEMIVTNTLQQLGIPAHIKGFHFLRTGLLAAFENQDLLQNMRKRFYPTIADVYSTSVDTIERGIRNAIRLSWERGNPELMLEFFSYDSDSCRGRPANAEFISSIADKLILRYAKSQRQLQYVS